MDRFHDQMCHLGRIVVLPDVATKGHAGYPSLQSLMDFLQNYLCRSRSATEGKDWCKTGLRDLTIFICWAKVAELDNICSHFRTDPGRQGKLSYVGLSVKPQW